MSSEFRHRASIALNIILALAVAALALRHTDRAPASSTEAPAGSGSANDAIRSETTSAISATSSPAASRPSPRYAEIASPSDRRKMLIDRLRALGAPNEVLARVAKMDLETQWEPRFEACKGDMAQTAAVQLEMELGLDAEMRAALGEEGFRQWDQTYMLWEAMSTEVEVDADEAAAIYALKKKLQQSNRDVDRARLDGTMDEAGINAAYDKAYSEYYRELNAVLGDERYAKSQQLDDAFFADNLRHQLAEASPSDTQFQELFKVEKQWNQLRTELTHLHQNDPTSPEYLGKLQALDEARDREYQRVLGAEAFANLQKARDPAYARMKKYETLWGLDDRKIDQVYATMKSYEQTVETYKGSILERQNRGQPIDWDAVNRDLQQFADQTQGTLRTSLGAESFGKLQNNHVLKFVQVRKRPQP